MVPALLVMQSVPVEAALIPAGLPQETLTWPNRQVALHHDLLLSVPSLHLCEALLLQLWQGVGHLRRQLSWSQSEQTDSRAQIMFSKDATDLLIVHCCEPLTVNSLGRLMYVNLVAMRPLHQSPQWLNGQQQLEPIWLSQSAV